MRLPRPYIPWSVREQVVDRQMEEAGMWPSFAAETARSCERRVRLKLEELFGRPVDLHHRPALINRERSTVFKTGALAYIPDANNPNYLIYLFAGAGEEHDVETRVRGQHGQHSDLALVRKRRRKERKAKRPKRQWPKRKFPVRTRRGRIGL